MPWRPRIRFSLAALLVAVTVLCLWLGVIADKAHKQRRAVEAVLRMDGGVMFDYQFQPHGDITGEFDLNAMPPGPTWARKMFGDDYFRNVVGLTIVGRERASDTAALDAICAVRRLKLIFAQRMALSEMDLAQLSALPKLEVLSLGGASLTDDSLRRFVVAPRLKALILAQTPITDAGLRHLAQLTTLARLDLNGTQITGDGLRHLSKLSVLEELSLAETRVDDAAVPHLRRLRHLKVLDLWRTAISDAAARQLQAALPKCRIIWAR